MSKVFIKVSDDNRIEFVNYVPFDEQLGMKKTEEELLKEGYLVDFVPPKEVSNKLAEMYYDSTKNEMYYKYSDIPPAPETQEEKVVRLEKDNEKLKSALLELEISQGDLLMEIAMLKMGGSF